MNFTDLLDERQIAYHTSGSGTRPGWLNWQCPYCGKDPYMGYNIRGRYCNCWNCGKHPLWEVVHQITGRSPAECFTLIGELPREIESWEKPRAAGKLTIPHGMDPIGPLSLLHSRYLRERGFTPSQIVSRYEVQSIGIGGGKLKWRLFIPIHYRGEICSWTTRAIGDRQPRYLSATSDQSVQPIENLLYGVDFCRNAVVLVEGPVDAWTVGPGAAAVMGLRCSPAQLEQISRFAIRAICFDAEEAAQERARRLANDLAVFSGVTHNVELETGKDCAEASKSEIESLRKEFLT